MEDYDNINLEVFKFQGGKEDAQYYKLKYQLTQKLLNLEKIVISNYIFSSDEMSSSFQNIKASRTDKLEQLLSRLEENTS